MKLSLRKKFFLLILPLVVTSVGTLCGALFTFRGFRGNISDLKADMAMRLEGQKLRDALDREVRFARRLAAMRVHVSTRELSQRRDPVRASLRSMMQLCAQRRDSETAERDREMRALTEVGTNFGRLYALEDEVLRLLEPGTADEAARSVNATIEPFLIETLMPLVDERIRDEEKNLDRDWARIERDFGRFWLALIFLSVLVLVVAFGSPWLLARRIIEPILQIREVAQKWGSGEFHARVRVSSADELAAVATSLNDMATSLDRTLVSKEYVDNILSSMMDALFVLSPDGLITKVNGAALMLLGYTEDELLNRPFGSLLPADDPARGAVVFELLRGTSVRDLERTLLTREGRAIPVLLTGSVMFESARQVSGIVCVAHDITQLKRAQEALHQSEVQLRHAQKMEMVGRLAGGVAHDFNNLLQALLTTVEMLRLKHQDPETVARTASEIESALKRGAALTRQLLLFARRGVEKPELLDLNEVVQNASALLRRITRENVSLVLDLAPGRLPVQADRGHLEQVLVNLVVNGSEAMVEGGNLTLRTLPEEGQEVALEVLDTGPGIPASLHARIFEPFFSTKVGEHGAGLGLAVVREIVTALGGRVEIDSAEGHGATFRVVLPRHPDVQSDLPSQVISMADLAQGHGERILVVEDEAAARESLKEMLALLGYGVTAVGSGEEAGVLPVEPAYDLLLTDLMLPGIAGGDLARGLLERWPHLKVIAMSGYTDDELTRSRVKGGKLRFLQKPFDLRTLASELRAAFDETA